MYKENSLKLRKLQYFYSSVLLSYFKFNSARRINKAEQQFTTFHYSGLQK